MNFNEVVAMRVHAQLISKSKKSVTLTTEEYEGSYHQIKDILECVGCIVTGYNVLTVTLK